MKCCALLLLGSLLLREALGANLSRIGGLYFCADYKLRSLKPHPGENRDTTLAWVESTNNRLIFHGFVASTGSREYADAVRKFNGKTVQLWRLWLWQENVTPETLTDRPLEEWVRISGEVLQADAGNGILVQLGDEERTPVFIRNYPHLLVDDVKFVAYVVRAGTHKYTATSGAVKTVRAYDYGTRLTEKEWQKEVEAFDAHAKAVRDAHTAETEAKKTAEAKKAEVAKFKGVKLRAESGSAEAMAELSEMYRVGHGTAVDEAAAEMWKLKAEAVKKG